jgi:transposase
MTTKQDPEALAPRRVEGARMLKRVQWLEARNGRIAIAILPPYAPELNLVEAIWACLNKHEIAKEGLNKPC